MKYLKIQNKGLLDIRLVALMGGTTKRNDVHKIGFFGTGLKYTLAFLFRNNLSFKIFVGTEEVNITSELETIGETEFEIICINGNRTSITANMGHDWKAWQICRELYSNALDEGEPIKEVVTDKNLKGFKNKTTFYIQIDSQIQQVLDDWNKYFIQNQEPMCITDDGYKIYAGGPSTKIYKNGILIHENDKVPALFSYDYASAKINEMREFQGSTNQIAVYALSQANGKVAQYFLENINSNPNYLEATMDYNWFIDWKGQWVDTIGAAKIITQKSIDQMIGRGISIQASDYIVVPEATYKGLTSQFPGVGALKVVQKGYEFQEHYDPILENKIKEALVILEACNYLMHPDLEFVYGYFEDRTIQAQIHFTEKKIYFSNTLLSTSLFNIITTIIEENEHFLTGLEDCSRSFQQHWVNLFTQKLLTEAQIEL